MDYHTVVSQMAEQPGKPHAKVPGPPNLVSRQFLVEIEGGSRTASTRAD